MGNPQVSVFRVNAEKLLGRESCRTTRRLSVHAIAIAKRTFLEVALARYLDFTAVLSRASPLNYEIVVNVFRTRPRHLVKFQSSRPIVAVRADSGNYRPIKPLLRPPDPRTASPARRALFVSFRIRHPSQVSTEGALTFRPPLFPASDARQTVRDGNTVGCLEIRSSSKFLLLRVALPQTTHHLCKVRFGK